MVLAFLAIAASASMSGAQIRDRIAHNFLDPEGARFRNVTVVRAKSDGGLIACGEVNSKNGIGAFTGYKHFIILSPTTPVMMEGEDTGNPQLNTLSEALLTSSWKQMCVPSAQLTTLVRRVQP